MNFDENRATVGSAVYTNKLDFCSWTGQTNNTFDVHSAYRWNFITFGYAMLFVNIIIISCNVGEGIVTKLILAMNLLIYLMFRHSQFP